MFQRHSGPIGGEVLALSHQSRSSRQTNHLRNATVPWSAHFGELDAMAQILSRTNLGSQVN